eukprot:71233-Pelagomonas_calceolata.AAC.1
MVPQVEDSDLASFHVHAGDIIVMGSDGLLDNLAELDIMTEVRSLWAALDANAYCACMPAACEQGALLVLLWLHFACATAGSGPQSWT